MAKAFRTHKLDRSGKDYKKFNRDFTTSQCKVSELCRSGLPLSHDQQKYALNAGRFRPEGEKLKKARNLKFALSYRPI